MASGSKSRRSALRAFVRTFPPLKLALAINDFICYLLRLILGAVSYVFRYIFTIINSFVKRLFQQLVELLQLFPIFRPSSMKQYKRIKEKEHKEAVPYRDDLLKRSITHYGSIILGTILYVFVYFVLVKHHTYTTISVAFILLLVYLIVLDNSHNIRSILMLCLPIMFTNRGRGLVFCSMLTILVVGPIRNTQINVKELHSSLNCCKQYLIIKTDKLIDKNVVQNIVRLEDIIITLVTNIKQLASEIRDKIDALINMAITVEQYMMNAIEELKKIVNICNLHTKDVHTNCYKTFSMAYMDCKLKLGFLFGGFCELVLPLRHFCKTIELPSFFCSLPAAVVDFIDQTVGERLRHYALIIENELYVDIDIEYRYYFNGTKSKPYKRIISEISFDVERKFWYVHVIARVFNLISLILVIWIISTATLYHMHYLSDLKYDNIYLDQYLNDIEKKRKSKIVRKHLAQEKSSDDNDETFVSVREDSFLFPLIEAHQRHYSRPFSFWMNKVEVQKVYTSGFVWLVITGYIIFFVLLDYILYSLINIIDTILKEILFTSDLPLVDIESKSGDKIVRYNRTYLNTLRKTNKLNKQFVNSESAKEVLSSDRNSSINTFYRRLMDSIEHNIPDDIAILDSLEQCLPRPNKPNYKDYETLLYLAILTLGAVILEAYALRTRHCIANLYYPRRAKQRAVWLYRKLLAEKPKYQYDTDVAKIGRQQEDTNHGVGGRTLELGLKLIADRAQRA